MEGNVGDETSYGHLRQPALTLFAFSSLHCHTWSVCQVLAWNQTKTPESCSSSLGVKICGQLDVSAITGSYNIQHFLPFFAG